MKNKYFLRHITTIMYFYIYYNNYNRDGRYKFTIVCKKKKKTLLSSNLYLKKIEMLSVMYCNYYIMLCVGGSEWKTHY